MSVSKVLASGTYSSIVILIFGIFSKSFFFLVDVKDAAHNVVRKKI